MYLCVSGVILKGLTLWKFVSDFCVCMFYVCKLIGFVDWPDRGSIYMQEEFRNVHLHLFDCPEVTLCGWQDIKIQLQLLITLWVLSQMFLGLTLLMWRSVVVFAGNDDVDEPEKVSAIQWKITQCLLWLLKENKRPSPNLFFANIISAFLRMKVLANSFYEWVKSKPFEHYTQFKNNELLAEWFSNSWF